MKAARVRILILLLFVCGAAFTWECNRNAAMLPVQGRVVGHIYKGYVVGYSIREQRHELETRIGVFDALGRLRRLSVGAAIPVLVDPKRPYVAVVNTVNGRYGLTISATMLLLLFSGVLAVAAWRERAAD